eukprot:223394-Rhodomonas_salina.1
MAIAYGHSVCCYAMCPAELAYGAMRYVRCRTELAYGTRYRVWCAVLSSAMLLRLRTCYDMSGTDLRARFCSILLRGPPVLTLHMVLPRYAVSGTDLSPITLPQSAPKPPFSNGRGRYDDAVLRTPYGPSSYALPTQRPVLTYGCLCGGWYGLRDVRYSYKLCSYALATRSPVLRYAMLLRNARY